jgi:hypothetical protein
MQLDEIKRQLAKPATKLTAGGFRPSGRDDESWIGKVFLYRRGESVPVDGAGQPMIPLAQLHLPDMPCCSPSLTGTRVVTIFIARTLPPALERMGVNWLVREYAHDELLERRDLPAQRGPLKAFPLKAALVEADYPLWDGGGVPLELEDEILRLERNGEIESYYDVVTHAHEHKIGGYPSFRQSGIDPGSGFEFVLQIMSDDKVGLNVVDGGSLMFWKHARSGEWAMYYDFY